MQTRSALTSGVVALGLVIGCGGASTDEPAVSPCFQVSLRITGGTPIQQQRAQVAINAADVVWANPKFWDLVKARHWLPSPDEGAIEGSKVVAALSGRPPSNQTYEITCLGAACIGIHTSTTGSTGACGFVSLSSTHIPGDSFLINTVAHENTHLVGRGAAEGGCTGEGARTSLYEDGDYKKVMLPWLVSYALGDLAQSFHDADGEPEKTMAYFEHSIVGDGGKCRRAEECCPLDAPANVVAIRKLDDHCKGVTCAPKEQLCPPP